MNQKMKPMKKTELDPKEFPTLSTWDPNLLEEVLESLAKTANPKKTEIIQADKVWAATMLEMDLQTQSGGIWSETETEDDPMTEHNREMMNKMKQGNIPWAQSYPGELYPVQKNEEDQFPM